MIPRRQLLNEGTQRLGAAGASDAALDAQWMLSAVTGVSRLLLLMDLDAAVSNDVRERYEALVRRREAGEPLQYVLGEADFMGHTFLVDSRVLIPRPDTETLCQAAIGRLARGGRMLDIGTGSGALAVSVALACESASVTAVDISTDALSVARVNGDALGARVEWLQSDLFAALSGREFDVIVSNPPYIPSRELEGLQMEVRREPQLALDGGPDGLDFYKRIVTELPGHLARGGALLLEVGDGQAADVAAMLAPHFSKTNILRDLAGLERVVTGDDYAG